MSDSDFGHLVHLPSTLDPLLMQPSMRGSNHLSSPNLACRSGSWSHGELRNSSMLIFLPHEVVLLLIFSSVDEPDSAILLLFLMNHFLKRFLIVGHGWKAFPAVWNARLQPGDLLNIALFLHPVGINLDLE